MYVLKKKVIIIFIAFTIFFTGIIYNLMQEIETNEIDIVLVSPPEMQYETSKTKNISNSLREEIIQYNDSVLTDEDANVFTMANHQISKDKRIDKNFESAIENAEIVIVIGDSFNSILDYYIKSETDKLFILIDNEEKFKYNNVIAINTDYKELFKKIEPKDNNEKYIYITNSENNDDYEKEYAIIDEVIDGDNNIEFIDVANYSEIELKEKLDDLVLKEYKNIISTSDKDVTFLIEYVQSMNKEISKQIESESSQNKDKNEEDTNKEDEEIENISNTANLQPDIIEDDEKIHNTYLHLYALGTDYTDEENIFVYEIDYTKEIIDILSNLDLNEMEYKEIEISNYKSSNEEK